MDKEPGKFNVAAGAVIVNNKQKVLLTQRSFERDHHPGEWEITTGRLNQNESFEQAIQREVKEELNIEIVIVSPIQTFHFFRGTEKIEHVGVTFICKYKEGEIKVDGIEETDYKWLDFDEAINISRDESIKSALKKTQEYSKNNL